MQKGGKTNWELNPWPSGVTSRPHKKGLVFGVTKKLSWWLSLERLEPAGVPLSISDCLTGFECLLQGDIWLVLFAILQPVFQPKRFYRNIFNCSFCFVLLGIVLSTALKRQRKVYNLRDISLGSRCQDGMSCVLLWPLF